MVKSHAEVHIIFFLNAPYILDFPRALLFWLFILVWDVSSIWVIALKLTELANYWCISVCSLVSRSFCSEVRTSIKRYINGPQHVLRMNVQIYHFQSLTNQFSTIGAAYRQDSVVVSNAPSSFWIGRDRTKGISKCMGSSFHILYPQISSIPNSCL